MKKYRTELLAAAAVAVLFVLTLTTLLSCYQLPLYGNDPRARRSLASQRRP